MICEDNKTGADWERRGLVQTGREEDWCSEDRMSAVVLEGEVATLRVVLSPTVLLDR